MKLGLEALTPLKDEPPQVIVQYHPRKHIALVKQLRDMEEELVASTIQQLKPLRYGDWESSGKRMTDEEYMQEFADSESTVYLLTDGITLFGAIVIHDDAEYKSTLSISMLLVAKEYRDRGYGSKLIDYIKTTYKGRYKYVNLTVTSKNPAVRLYERHGFTEYQKKMVAKI